MSSTRPPVAGSFDPVPQTCAPAREQDRRTGLRWPIRLLVVLVAPAAVTPWVARAEEAIRVVSTDAGGRPGATSVSASIRIQVVVEPRLQLRQETDRRVALSSNRGRVLIACDDPARCAARAIGDRGIVAGSIDAAQGGYTVAQP